MPEKVRIDVEEGPLRGESYVFRKHDVFVFGRGSSCAIRLPEDGSISRRHFQIEVETAEVLVRDLGSLNGTWVNGVRHGERRQASEAADYESLYPAVPLKHGDLVKAGLTVFRINIERPAQPPPAAAAPGTEKPPAIPEEVGGYKVEELIAEGGSGAVYRARRKDNGCTVALKILFPGPAADERVRKAQQREINCMKKLSHPNLVSLLDSGFIGQTIYCVTEYCESGSVAGLIKARDGSVPLSKALPVFMQSLSALAYIHVLGYVHRDLKPSNILLTGPADAPCVKISDLGLAKNFESAGLSGITIGKAARGTFPFMPPEQVVDFKRFRPSGDVWSLGATFYNMLTGKFPHDFPPGQDPLNVVLNGPVVPLSGRLPGVPERIAALIGKALALKPEQRCRNAGEMLADFRRELKF